MQPSVPPRRSSVAFRLSASLWAIGLILICLGGILGGALLWLRASYDDLITTRSQDVKRAAELATNVQLVATGAFQFASILRITLPDERDLRIQPAKDALRRIGAQFDRLASDPALRREFAESADTLITRLHGLIEQVSLSVRMRNALDRHFDAIREQLGASTGSGRAEADPRLAGADWERRAWTALALALIADSTKGPGRRNRLERRACALLDDPAAAEPANGVLPTRGEPAVMSDRAALVGLFCGDNNVFARIDAHLATERAVRGLSSQVRLASNQLSEVVLRLVQATDQRLRDETAEKHKALIGGLIVIAVIVAVGVVLLIAVLAYLDRGVLSRFKALHGIMEAHVAGAAPAIRVGGRDEISDMAGAFQLFVEKRRNAEESLASSLELLKERNDALLRLSGGIAHEVSNLLHPIRNYAKLTMKLVPTEDRIMGYQQTILSCAHHATEILRNVLYFAQGSARPIRAHRMPDLAESTLAFLRRTNPETLDIACEVCCARSVTVDRDEFWQVLGNLIKNAADAMDGSGRVAIMIECRTLDADAARPFDVPAGAYGVITVSDSGTGMDEATLKRVFDPFFSTKEVGRGTGLGLSIVHGIVRRWNGGIQVFSRVGAGTSVVIALPLVADPEDTNESTHPLSTDPLSTDPMA